MYMVNPSTQPFKDYHLQSQVPTLAHTQWEAWPEPHSEDMDRSVIPVEESWQGNATPLSRPSLLSKSILAPTTSLYLLTAFFTAFMSNQQNTKIGVSLAYTETCALTQPAKSTQRRAGFAIPSLSLWSKDIEKRCQEATLLDLPLECECLRMLCIHLYHHLGVVVQHPDPFAELWFEPSGLQNRCQKLMVHPIEGLGLIQIDQCSFSVVF